MEYTPALSLANNEFVSVFWVYQYHLLLIWMITGFQFHLRCYALYPLIPWDPISKILPVTTPEPSGLAS